MAVANSTIVDELGLFSLNGADTDVLLCTYAGTKLRDLKKVTDESPRFDYLWENSRYTFIIDAYLKHSCFGRYANDALYESRCNAMIVERHGKVYLISTRPIAPNEEVFVNYGAGYWASRFHRYALEGSTELSSLQRDLVKAYRLVPLPDVRLELSRMSNLLGHQWCILSLCCLQREKSHYLKGRFSLIHSDPPRI